MNRRDTADSEDSTPDSISARLERVRERIALAVARSGRPPSAVRLVLASKTQTPAAIRAAYLAGARDFGENYVQEAVRKRAALIGDPEGARWHLIGHLQTKKVNAAVECFDLIQSLDSERLAAALARARPSARFPVLVEVNIGGEASKTGVAVDDVERLIDSVRGMVAVQGLMTIPPVSWRAADSRGARAYFEALRRLRDRLAAATGLALSELSMGMSEDFEIAIEEGATIVRIGRAVFGERIRERQ
jgi:pyridoxal phosphate enzyme (YggS family)